MMHVILIIWFCACANTQAFIWKNSEDALLYPHLQRHKRQAPLGIEKTYFNENLEITITEGRSKKIYPIRSVLDGAPESPEKLRIRSDGKSSANEGRVEVYNSKNKKWGLVCDDYWNLPDANVSCKQLGFLNAAREATRQDHHGRGNWTKKDYIIDKIKCLGSEASIFECSHEMSSTCSGGSSGVSCIFNSGCSYGWVSFNGVCYQVVDKKMTFQKAEEHCKKQNSKLAYILDRNENNFLSNVLYSQFKKINQVWTGGYYAKIKMNTGKIVKRWNWQSTIHNVDQWNTSFLWFQGYGEIKSDKRPLGDVKMKSCLALNRLYGDSQRSNQIYDVNYFWWDNLSCNTKLPFICQKITTRGRTDCYEGNGAAYRGTTSRTNQGTKCAKWSNPSLTVNDKTHPNAGLGNHNYCRNPDNDIMPWCWVNADVGIYGYCVMEKCSEKPSLPQVTELPRISDPPGKGKGGCADNQFFCPSMTSYNRKCLALSRVCDQVNDCSGLEDENPEFCKTFFCRENEFYCKADTFCILKSNICDGQRHCSDNADEKNCSIINENEILVKFDKFKSEILMVDDKIVYANLRLEECVQKCRVIYPQFGCRSLNYFPPNETRIFSECHLMKQLQSEIPDSLKKIHYPGDHYSLKTDCTGKYKCSSGMCIALNKSCDSRNDCGDNSDEMNCHSVTFPPFEIRLTGSKNDWEGKVEIRYQGEWGYVCDDKFTINEAHVICKQLGFIEALEYLHGAGIKFGKVRDPIILLDELKCKGTEFSIEECPHDLWRKHNCKSEEIAGVICKVDRACMNTEFRCQKDKICIKMSQMCDGKPDCSDSSDEPEGQCFLSVKLVNGPDSFSGRIEIQRSFSKGTVCDDGFTNSEASVICRMLGISGRAQAVTNNRFGPGVGEIVLSNPRCRGNETSLVQCNSFKWGEHKCSHKEDAGVICGLPILEQSITTTVAPLKKSEQVPGVTCGKKPITQRRGRVVGGFETVYGAFPWQVGVRHRVGDYDIHWCGGSILSEDWIISASHCYEKPKNQYFVRTGDWNNNEMDIYEQSFEIEELFLNPKYKGPPTFDFDTALIKIKRNNGIGIILNDHVQPVCLPKPGVVPDLKTKCLVSGWGDTLVETAEKLLAAEVPLIKAERCKEFYKDRITDRMQCAGYEAGGIDTCQGDSGGPLVCQVNGIYTIFGATSWGDGCAVPRSPGVYAKVDSMLDFVKEKTGF